MKENTTHEFELKEDEQERKWILVEFHQNNHCF